MLTKKCVNASPTVGQGEPLVERIGRLSPLPSKGSGRTLSSLDGKIDRDWSGQGSIAQIKLPIASLAQ
jgi:hypothetical protein